MRSQSIQILSGADTASVTGATIDANQMVSASFSPIFGDVTAAGTVTIQCSNDPATNNRNIFVPTNWANIPNATSTVASGVAAPILIPVMSFGYIRAVFTRSSGGSTTVIVNMTSLSV